MILKVRKVNTILIKGKELVSILVKIFQEYNFKSENPVLSRQEITKQRKGIFTQNKRTKKYTLN